MKKYRYMAILIPLLSLVLLQFACNDNNDGVLIWTDPPTSADTLYQNPIFEPDLADPTVIRGTDGWFYAYGTENQWFEGVTRIVPIVRSRNLVKWSYSSDAFSTKPDWKNDGGIWAPCMLYDETLGDNPYALFYSFSTWGDGNPGIGVAFGPQPYGPFTDHGKIFDSQSIGVGNSIDPSVLQITSRNSKTTYLFWGSFQGIYGIQLSNDMTSTVGEKFKIAGNMFEAAYIYPKDGKFFFFGSAGSCCEGLDSQYRISVAVADNFRGPYYGKDGEEIINDWQEGTPFLRGDPDKGWVGPGHNGEIITDDEGRDFIFYHAISTAEPYLPGGATRRPMLMDEIIWVDGWPTIEGGVPSNTLKRAPVFNRDNN